MSLDININNSENIAPKNLGKHNASELSKSIEKDRSRDDDLNQIAQSILLDLDEYDKKPVLSAVSKIPVEQQEDVVRRAKLLLPISKNDPDYITEIRTTKVVAERVFMLKTIAAIAPADRDDVIAKAFPLLKGLSVYHQVLILRAISSIPSEQRENVISNATPLLVDLKNGEQYSLILKAVAEIPTDKRAIVISQKALLHLQEIKDGFKRAKILQKNASSSKNKGHASTEGVKLALKKAKYQDEAYKIKGQVQAKYLSLLKGNPMFETLSLTAGNGSVLHGGLNIILDFIKSQSGGNQYNCFVCTKAEMVKDVLSTINKSNFEGKLAIVMQKGDILHHMIPILIERKKNEDDQFTINVCIMDSLGSHNDSLKSLYNIGFRGSDIPNLEIYLPLPERQTDFVSCAMFSLNDTKQFFKNEKFFEELTHLGRLQKEEKIGSKKGSKNRFDWESNVQFVKNLPPENMKLEQTMRMNYRMANDPDRPQANEPQFDLDDRPVNKRPRFPKDASAKSKAINMKAEDLYIKYLGVINSYIEKLPFKELEALTSQYDVSHITVDVLEGLSENK